MTRENVLIQKIEQGDTNAVDQLIEMFYPEILRYCLWHVPNRSLAEDAAQETFLKFIRYLDRYTHKGSLKPFLYQIAANTCTDIWRKNRHFDMSLEEITADPAYTESGFENVQSDMEFCQLINRLPENLQEIVLLRFGQDLTIREIAEVLNVPLRTVQSRLRSALKRIKKEALKGGLS